MNGVVVLFFLAVAALGVADLTPENAHEKYPHTYITLRNHSVTDPEWSNFKVTITKFTPQPYLTATMLVVDDYEKVIPHILYATGNENYNQEKGLYPDYIYNKFVGPEASNTQLIQAKAMKDISNIIPGAGDYVVKTGFFSGTIHRDDHKILGGDKHREVTYMLIVAAKHN